MKRSRCIRLALATLTVLVLFSEWSIAPLPSGVRQVESAIPIFNFIGALVRGGKALDRRNAVYKEAGTTAAEINAYYDNLIGKATEIRGDLIRNAASGETPVAFVRSYTRIGAALEAERAAAIRMIEAEKNEARKEFERGLVKEIRNVLLASPGAQQIIGRIRDGLGNMREAAVAVQVAVQGGRPLQALQDEIGEMVGDIPLVREAAQKLGTNIALKVDSAMGGFVQRVERLADNIQEGMDEAIGVVDGLETELTRLEERERRPISLIEDNSLLGEIIPVDGAYGALDVIASAYAGAAALDGNLPPGTSRTTMMGRVRGALLDGRVEDIRSIITNVKAGSVYCTDADVEQYDAAASALNLPLDGAHDAPALLYMVCYKLPDQIPVHAKRYDGIVTTAADETAEGTAEDSVESATDEASSEPLQILSLETRDGWCFAPSPDLENTICRYEIDFRVAFAATGESAYLECTLYGVDYYRSEVFSGKLFQTAAGIWEGNIAGGGFYADLGEYTEVFSCDLHDGGRAGALLSHVELEIIAPLTTVRER